MHRILPSAWIAACLILDLLSAVSAQEAAPLAQTTAVESLSVESAAIAPATDAKSVPCATRQDCATREDEVWLISTRQLCFPDWKDPGSYELDVRRYAGDAGWCESSTDEFLSLPPLPTVLYVHGNRVEWCEASQNGWRAYHSLGACANAPPKMRFVIWTWPSDQVRGPLRDIRSKANRADNETLFLGWFLSQLNPKTPVSLIGYSYGSRIITGGLHLLAGGTWCELSLPQSANPGLAPVRVALLAAALDHDWLCPGHLHGEAMERIEHLLVFHNNCDPALQHYDRVDRCSCAQALGYVGLPCADESPMADKVEQFDASPFVGRSHDEHRYLGSATIQAEICRCLFLPLPTANGER